MVPSSLRLFAMSFTLASTAACAAAADTPLPPATRPEVYATHAMACTAHPLATQAALDILRAGGSAVDAAIAANACLGLMEPTGCGIGGDLFAIIWDPASAKLHAYNGSGRSPAGVSLDQLRAILREHNRSQIPTNGPLTVTVPGCVDAWAALSEKFGKVPLAAALAPAIRAADEGFPVSPRIAEAWDLSVRKFAASPDEFPGFIEQFTIPGSTPPRAPRAGEIWTNPALASTYRAIAERGRSAFYSGDIPAAIERTLASHLKRPWLTSADFAAHTGNWVEPISATYRGYKVWEIPPNSQGLAALQILTILEGFDIASMGWGSPDFVHTFIEAKKLAFEDRARLYADPAFAKTPISTLLSADYSAHQRAAINPAAAAQRVPTFTVSNSPPNGPDTTYLTVADDRGMMVSLIQSNYRGMGSGVVPLAAPVDGVSKPLGFMLQSRGEQFALLPDHPNAFAPAKRPFHTIIPAFVTKDDKPYLSFGVMGGAMQPQGHAQILINLLDFGMSLQQAGDAPRIHHDGSTEPQGAVDVMSSGGVVNLEPGFPPDTIAELTRRGHVLRPAPTAVFGGYQAIRVSADPRTGTRVYTGASERRKDGHAAGY